MEGDFVTNFKLGFKTFGPVKGVLPAESGVAAARRRAIFDFLLVKGAILSRFPTRNVGFIFGAFSKGKMSSGTSLEAGGASAGYTPGMCFSLGLELRLKLEFNSERKCEFFLGAVSETETGISVRKSLSSNKFRKV